MKVILVPIGGLIGAILGGVLWAKYIQWTGNTAGFIAIGIGVLTGFGMVLTSSGVIDPSGQRHWLILAVGAAFFALVGIVIGKYLDVRWNAITQFVEEIIASEPLLSDDAATEIAKTRYSGSSKWELMKSRMDWFDLIFSAIAVIVAFYITSNQRIRKIFYTLKDN